MYSARKSSRLMGQAIKNNLIVRAESRSASSTFPETIRDVCTYVRIHVRRPRHRARLMSPAGSCHHDYIRADSGMTRRYGEGKMKRDAGEMRLCLGLFPHVGVSLPEEYGNRRSFSRKSRARERHTTKLFARAFVLLSGDRSFCSCRMKNKEIVFAILDATRSPLTRRTKNRLERQ